MAMVIALTLMVTGTIITAVAAFRYWNLAREAIRLCEEIRDARDEYRKERDALRVENETLRGGR
jgi:hypothetical protein